MARTKRYYKKRYRRWKRRYYKRSKKSSPVINASSKSKVTLKCRMQDSLQVVIPAGTNFSNVVCVNPFFWKDAMIPANAKYDSVLPVSTECTALYRNFCELYESVKVDGVYLRMTVQNIIGHGGSFDALNVYTAWDRQWNLDDQYDDYSYPSVSELKRLPGCQAASITNNTGSTVYRYCKASTFFERTTQRYPRSLSSYT